jgi:S1-C subfamily serine protease
MTIALVVGLAGAAGAQTQSPPSPSQAAGAAAARQRQRQRPEKESMIDSRLTPAQRRVVTHVPRVEMWVKKGAQGHLLPQGTGTGILLAPEALGRMGKSGALYVATNAHVVSGADAVTLTFAHPEDSEKGLMLEADLEAIQPDVDLALLKIRPSQEMGWIGRPNGIQPLQLGEMPKMGARVATIGFEGGRLGVDVGNVRRGGKWGMIDTNEIVSHGNSGGPLLDARGRVVGMSSQIRPLRSGRVPGMHLSLRSIRAFLERVDDGDVEADGTVQVSTLGMGFRSLSLQKVKLATAHPEVRNRKILLPHDGPMVEIASVVQGSAADKAGIEPGDIVLSVSMGGEDVTAVAEDILAATRIARPRGKQDVKLTVLRPTDDHGKLLDLTVTGSSLEKRREMETRLLADLTGLSVEQVPLTPKMREAIKAMNPEANPGRFGLRVSRFAPKVPRQELMSLLGRMQRSGMQVPFEELGGLAGGTDATVDVKKLLNLDLRPGDIVYQAVTDHGHGEGNELERVEAPEDLFHFVGHGVPEYHLIREHQEGPRAQRVTVDQQSPMGFLWFSARLAEAHRTLPRAFRQGGE